MLRVLNNLKCLSLNSIPTASSSVNLNLVRWRRKPRKPMWKGTAKSKIFRVAPRPEIPLEDSLELQRLYNKYRTERKTIYRFLYKKYNVQNLQKDDEDAKRKEFEEDFAHCMKINDEWNAEQKVLRESRMKKEFENAIETAKKQKLETENRRKQLLEEREEIVRVQKESAKSFILPEMLDEAIEKALANPVDYNFALDLNGNKIIGRETEPNIEEQKSASMKR